MSRPSTGNPQSPTLSSRTATESSRSLSSHPLPLTAHTEVSFAHALCRNTVHRHEPPITRSPVLVLHKDEPRQFIVISKPGSVVSAHRRLVCDFMIVADRLCSISTASTCYRKVLQAHRVGAPQIRSRDHRLQSVPISPSFRTNPRPLTSADPRPTRRQQARSIDIGSDDLGDHRKGIYRTRTRVHQGARQERIPRPGPWQVSRVSPCPFPHTLHCWIV